MKWKQRLPAKSFVFFFKSTELPELAEEVNMKEGFADRKLNKEDAVGMFLESAALLRWLKIGGGLCAIWRWSPEA